VPPAALAGLARGAVDDALAGGLALDGDTAPLTALLAVLDQGDRSFNIIEP
jgi:alkyl sulfatase BDS1-like metallo-beta-lactamase superfamily hydrolase